MPSEPVTTYKLARQWRHGAVFACVSVKSGSRQIGDDAVVLSPNAFDWSAAEGSYSLLPPRPNGWLENAAIQGTQLALNDLKREDVQITLTEIKFNLVDATTAGFALAAYESTHACLTGATRHELVTKELLSEIEGRLRALPNDESADR